jgi:hypothetical protein
MTLQAKIRKQRKRWEAAKPGSPQRRRARRAIRKLKRIQAASVRPGSPWWGGGKRIIQEEVWPIVRAAGIRPTSGKRRETYGNPSSDHYYKNVWAFAKDYATASNYALAQRIRKRLDLGIHSDYAEFYISRYGHSYRVQIIAGTHGTGPHLHVGIKRVS